MGKARILFNSHALIEERFRTAFGNREQRGQDSVIPSPCATKSREVNDSLTALVLHVEL
jgi:hypothetical protein